MAIAEEVLFSNDIRCTIRKHTTNVKSELRLHKIKKYSDLIASQCNVVKSERGSNIIFPILLRLLRRITSEEDGKGT